MRFLWLPMILLIMTASSTWVAEAQSRASQSFLVHVPAKVGLRQTRNELEFRSTAAVQVIQCCQDPSAALTAQQLRDGQSVFSSTSADGTYVTSVQLPLQRSTDSAILYLTVVPVQ